MNAPNLQSSSQLSDQEGSWGTKFLRIAFFPCGFKLRFSDEAPSALCEHVDFVSPFPEPAFISVVLGPFLPIWPAQAICWGPTETTERREGQEVETQGQSHTPSLLKRPVTSFRLKIVIKKKKFIFPTQKKLFTK